MAMAAGNTCQHLIITPDAHHYILYDPNDKRSQRGTLIAERFDGVLGL